MFQCYHDHSEEAIAVAFTPFLRVGALHTDLPSAVAENTLPSEEAPANEEKVPKGTKLIAQEFWWLATHQVV